MRYTLNYSGTRFLSTLNISMFIDFIHLNSSDTLNCAPKIFSCVSNITAMHCPEIAK